MEKLLKPLSSIRLTLVCLGLMMVLVFAGTLAQVRIGTFAAQKSYFGSFLIYAALFGAKVPVFPGGLTVGAVWLANLVAAFVFHFRFVPKKVGLLISHAGLILLLSGQFFTQMLSKESQMPIEVGRSTNYSEAPREAELTFTMVSDPNFDEVTVVPQSRLHDGASLESAQLPFRVEIKKYFPNVKLGMGGGPSLATEGIGTRVSVTEAPPVSSDDETNAVSVFMEIFDGPKSLGTWLVSAGLGAPQSVIVGGKEFTFAMRPRRTYYPFTIQLKEFKHDIYPGTDIPKNFSSRIHLTNAETNESRDALIYMNHPLRYQGKTFYQASFANNDTVSIFQVVENPAWLTPYVSCAMVVAGLAIHFVLSLLSFLRKRRV